MFRDHTGWLDEPCYYVIAADGHLRAWLAGPYRTAAEAAAALPWARDWATRESGDPDAAAYEYGVFRHFSGGTHSVLGPVEP